MPKATTVDGVELYFETRGNPDAPNKVSFFLFAFSRFKEIYSFHLFDLFPLFLLELVIWNLFLIDCISHFAFYFTCFVFLFTITKGGICDGSFRISQRLGLTIKILCFPPRLSGKVPWIFPVFISLIPFIFENPIASRLIFHILSFFYMFCFIFTKVFSKDFTIW